MQKKSISAEKWNVGDHIISETVPIMDQDGCIVLLVEEAIYHDKVHGLTNSQAEHAAACSLVPELLKITEDMSKLSSSSIEDMETKMQSMRGRAQKLLAEMQSRVEQVPQPQALIQPQPM